jgi:ABC-type transport system involved in multi-copper enzyme maturation permease subunit
MKKSSIVRIVYALSALITTNFRMSLQLKNALFPLIVLILPLIPTIAWRVIYHFYPPPPGSNESDPYFLFSILCASMYLQFIVPLLALGKGMSTFSEEVEEGTLMFLFLRPVPRTIIVLGKYLAFICAIGFLLVISLWLTFCILGSVPDSDMIMYDFNVLVKDTWVLFLGLSAYGAVMMLIGVYFKHSLMVGIILLFVWDAFAAYLPGTANKLTIKHYLQSIFPHDRTETGLAALLSEHPPDSLERSLLTLFLLISVCIVMTTLVLKHKQFGGKQETA